MMENEEKTWMNQAGEPRRILSLFDTAALIVGIVVFLIGALSLAVLPKMDASIKLK